jgi:hypothetical protein
MYSFVIRQAPAGTAPVSISRFETPPALSAVLSPVSDRDDDRDDDDCDVAHAPRTARAFAAATAATTTTTTTTTTSTVAAAASAAVAAAAAVFPPATVPSLALTNLMNLAQDGARACSALDTLCEYDDEFS